MTSQAGRTRATQVSADRRENGEDRIPDLTNTRTWDLCNPTELRPRRISGSAGHVEAWTYRSRWKAPDVATRARAC